MAVDWDDFLNAPLMSSGMFGEDEDHLPVYTTPDGSVSFPIDGVFDDGTVTLNPLGLDGPEITTTNPVLGVRLAQFPAGYPPVTNGRVLIPRTGKTYVVRAPRPDGKGWALLDLNLAS